MNSEKAVNQTAKYILSYNEVGNWKYFIRRFKSRPYIKSRIVLFLVSET